MTEPEARAHHTGLRREDVGGYVLIPGDPARTALLAAHFDGAREVAFNREYRTFTGQLEGVPVSACSSGMGGPSTAVGIEELSGLGVHTFIRVGTCGAAQPEIAVGDVVIATGAVRTEATATAYVPVEYPAVADRGVVAALEAGAAEVGARAHTGIVRAVDALYADLTPELLPRGPVLAADIDMWRRAGVLANDMESATLLVLASLKRLRAGTVLLCVNALETGAIGGVPADPMERLARVAVAALRRLIEADRRAST